jgi:hypothetical protein
LAVELAELGHRALAGWRRHIRPALALTVTCLTLWGASNVASGLAAALPERTANEWFPGALNGYLDTNRMSALLRTVRPNDVVLAQPLTGWQVPAFTGRLVATLHPLAFVSDLAQRRDSVSTFFDPATPADVRDKILRRYCVSFVLVDTSAQRGFKPPGQVRASDDRFLLMSVGTPPRPCG